MGEYYVIQLDAAIESELQLFAAFTDAMYLGESGIPGWAQFYSLLLGRLSGADIQVRVEILDDFSLWPKVSEEIEWIEEALMEDCPDKLMFIRPGH
ncbi:MAG: hypothetical protein VYE13_06100 [Pseudomonadota bacterium]|jgi:hypothetical protein|nr:hypothetical protein [Pseudomonadota bacterium]